MLPTFGAARDCDCKRALELRVGLSLSPSMSATYVTANSARGGIARNMNVTLSRSDRGMLHRYPDGERDVRRKPSAVRCILRPVRTVDAIVVRSGATGGWAARSVAAPSRGAPSRSACPTSSLKRQAATASASTGPSITPNSRPATTASRSSSACGGTRERLPPVPDGRYVRAEPMTTAISCGDRVRMALRSTMSMHRGSFRGDSPAAPINYPREYKHTLGTLINCLIEQGFILQRVLEEHPCQPDITAAPARRNTSWPAPRCCYVLDDLPARLQREGSE